MEEFYTLDELEYGAVIDLSAIAREGLGLVCYNASGNNHYKMIVSLSNPKDTWDNMNPERKFKYVGRIAEVV